MKALTRYLPLLAALAVAPALTAAEPIKVGEYASLTGKEAGFGQTSHHGVVLAIEETHALMSKSTAFGKADLVLYTDAMAPFELDAAVAELKKLKAKADFQLHVVHVVPSASVGADIVAGCGKALKELSDSWVTLPSNETSLRPMDALFSI